MESYIKASSLLAELSKMPTGTERAAKWQYVCERFWAAPAEGSGITEGDIATFLETIRDPAMFELARLVVPDLRQRGEVAVEHPRQSRILESTRSIREKRDGRGQHPRPNIDEILHRAEKQLFLDSEMHRARVFLCQAGAFGDEDEKLKRWFDASPWKEE